MRKVNTLINYLTLLFVIIIGVFVVRVFTELKNNQTQTKQLVVEVKNTAQQTQGQISCIAGYFNIQNRSGNTILNCEVK